MDLDDIGLFSRVEWSLWKSNSVLQQIHFVQIFDRIHILLKVESYRNPLALSRWKFYFISHVELEMLSTDFVETLKEMQLRRAFVTINSVLNFHLFVSISQCVQYFCSLTKACCQYLNQYHSTTTINTTF